MATAGVGEGSCDAGSSEIGVAGVPDGRRRGPSSSTGPQPRSIPTRRPVAWESYKASLAPGSERSNPHGRKGIGGIRPSLSLACHSCPGDHGALGRPRGPVRALLVPIRQGSARIGRPPIGREGGREGAAGSGDPAPAWYPFECAPSRHDGLGKGTLSPSGPT